MSAARKRYPGEFKKVKWVRPHPKHHPIRVHYIEAGESRTFCGAVDIKSSPYVNVPGHAAISTDEDVTCRRCLAKAGRHA